MPHSYLPHFHRKDAGSAEFLAANTAAEISACMCPRAAYMRADVAKLICACDKH